MAVKINWHRYGTKLRHCHPMYTPKKLLITVKSSPSQSWSRESVDILHNAYWEGFVKSLTYLLRWPESVLSDILAWTRVTLEHCAMFISYCFPQGYQSKRPPAKTPSRQKNGPGEVSLFTSDISSFNCSAHHANAYYNIQIIIIDASRIACGAGSM